VQPALSKHNLPLLCPEHLEKACQLAVVLSRGWLSLLELVVEYLVVIAGGKQRQNIWFPLGYLFLL